jgi:hypothetical protein
MTRPEARFWSSASLDVVSIIARVARVVPFLSCLLIAGCTPENATPQIALATPPAPGTCAEWMGQPVDRSCIPRMAAAGKPLVLEIEERCGGCGDTAERCTVAVDGHVISLSLDGKTCEPPPGVACSEVCGKNRVRCKLPALDQGRYEVHYGDTSRHIDTFDVVMRADATTACTLEDAPPQDASRAGGG